MKHVVFFVIRWFLNAFGLWLSLKLLVGDSPVLFSVNRIHIFLIAGLIFSIINSLVKPLLVAISLPAILMSLGLFMLVLNGALVYLTFIIYPGISIGFFNSIVAGIILSLINYVVSTVLDI